jgi:hypothetical protein
VVRAAGGGRLVSCADESGRKLLVFAALLALVNVVVALVLESNLESGVYPVDADSIGIPLAKALMLSGVGGALLISIALLPLLVQLLGKRMTSPLLHLSVVGAVALANLLAVEFFFLWGESWFLPHHYPIAASCGLVAAAILFYAVDEYRPLYIRIKSGGQPQDGGACY